MDWSSLIPGKSFSLFTQRLPSQIFVFFRQRQLSTFKIIILFCVLCAFNSCSSHQWKNLCELIWILSGKIRFKNLTHQWKRFELILINFLKQIRTHMIFSVGSYRKVTSNQSIFTDTNRARRRHIYDFRILLDCTQIKVKSRTPVNFQWWSVIPKALLCDSRCAKIEGKHLKPSCS